MSTIILDIEGKNLYEWEERILTLAASQQANTYFMGFLSKQKRMDENCRLNYNNNRRYRSFNTK
jgi:hypothetical protein